MGCGPWRMEYVIFSALINGCSISCNSTILSGGSKIVFTTGLPSADETGQASSTARHRRAARAADPVLTAAFFHFIAHFTAVCILALFSFIHVRVVQQIHLPDEVDFALEQVAAYFQLIPRIPCSGPFALCIQASPAAPAPLGLPVRAKLTQYCITMCESFRSTSS